MHRLREAIKTIVSCSQSARCLGKKKNYMFTFREKVRVCVCLHMQANETLSEKNTLYLRNYSI